MKTMFLVNRARSSKYMNLGSFKVGRGNRNQIFEDLIKHYQTLIANDGPNSEAFYWLGVAAKDYEQDKKKALEYFIYSAMIMHDYDRFKEVYDSDL